MHASTHRPAAVPASWTAGQQIPHVVIDTIEGRGVEYRSLWQRQGLLLVTTGDDAGALAYAQRLPASLGDLSSYATVLLVAREVAGLPAPGIAIADRWGEIFFTVSGRAAGDLPSPDELLEWLSYVQRQCPECQGEAR